MSMISASRSCSSCVEEFRGCCCLDCKSAPRLRPVLPGHQRYQKWHIYRDAVVQSKLLVWWDTDSLRSQWEMMLQVYNRYGFMGSNGTKFCCARSGTCNHNSCASFNLSGRKCLFACFLRFIPFYDTTDHAQGHAMDTARAHILHLVVCFFFWSACH